MPDYKEGNHSFSNGDVVKNDKVGGDKVGANKITQDQRGQQVDQQINNSPIQIVTNPIIQQKASKATSSRSRRSRTKSVSPIEQFINKAREYLSITILFVLFGSVYGYFIGLAYARSLHLTSRDLEFFFWSVMGIAIGSISGMLLWVLNIPKRSRGKYSNSFSKVINNAIITLFALTIIFLGTLWLIRMFS